jgi:hypothetical protein
VFTSSPVVSGLAQDGQTLLASPGVWSGTQPIAYAFQWERCNASGLNCGVIFGATGSTYVLSAADVGWSIRVLVTAMNTAGNASAVSAATAVVQSAYTPPANTSQPTIEGTAQQGRTMTANPGTWSGTQPINYAYQWLGCDSTGAHCVPIGGATAITYRPTSADLGRTLRVTVTAGNIAGTASASSAPTAVVVSASTVALWHMDETSGTTMFDSVGTHNGTLHSVQLGVAGFSRTGYGFNGSSSYVSVPSADALNPHSADITITIHLKTAGTPPPPPDDWDLIRKGYYGSGSAEYKVEFQHTGQASCGFEGTGGYAELVAGPSINDGQWHTISCVKTSTAIRVVVDGQVFSKAADVGSIANNSNVVIGAHPGSDWTKGRLDEASIRIG